MLGSYHQPYMCYGAQIHAGLPCGSIPPVEATNDFWLVLSEIKTTLHSRKLTTCKIKLCRATISRDWLKDLCHPNQDG